MTRGRRLLAWGGGLAGLLAALVLAAPLLAPYSPDEQVDPPAAMRRPPGTALAAVHLAGDRCVVVAERRQAVGAVGLRILLVAHPDQRPVEQGDHGSDNFPAWQARQ